MWQLFLILYLSFGAVVYLMRRVFAQKLGEYNLLVNLVFYLFFVLPTGIILGFFLPHDFNIGLANLLFILFGSVIWPLSNIISFHANRKVDVGIFVIIVSLSPLFTMLIAFPLLKETLTSTQYIGVMFLIFSGVFAATSQIHKHFRANLSGVLTCLLSAVILGVAIAYERFMLSRVDFGTYLILGWTSQVVWSTIFANKELKNLPKLFRIDKKTSQALLAWGGVSILRSIGFIFALKLSGSASIISAATNFTTVTVVIAAYFFLNERQHMTYKWIATVIGIVGLFLLSS